MRIKFGVAGLMAAVLAGCTTSLNVIGDPYVAPAKFQFLRCEDIAKQVQIDLAKQQELHVLMDRASTGGGGSTVNMFVYGPDLNHIESELRELRTSAGEKRCSDEILKAAPKPDLNPLH